MSKKLLGSIAGMAAVVAIYTLDAFKVVDKETTIMAIAAVTGLGGFQVYRQAVLDATKVTPSDAIGFKLGS